MKKGSVIGLAAGLFFSASCILTAGEKVFDFAEAASLFSLSSGRYLDPAEAARQLEAKSDGLHIHLDAAKMAPRPLWCTLTVPAPLAEARAWLGQRVVLVMRSAPFRRVTKNMAINLTDRDGETFQFLPRKIRINQAEETETFRRPGP